MKTRWTMLAAAPVYTFAAAGDKQGADRDGPAPNLSEMIETPGD